jgi:hypothetical protein
MPDGDIAHDGEQAQDEIVTGLEPKSKHTC